MKAIDTAISYLQELSREELIQLASKALMLAEQQAAMDDVFTPELKAKLDKKIEDIENGRAQLRTFSAESYRQRFHQLKNERVEVK